MIYRCDETEMKVKRMIKEIMGDVINEYEAGLAFQQQNMPAYVVSIFRQLSDNQINNYRNENYTLTVSVKDLLEYSQFLVLAANEAHSRNAEISFNEYAHYDFDEHYDCHCPFYAVLRDRRGNQLSFSDYRLQHTTVYDD